MDSTSKHHENTSGDTSPDTDHQFKTRKEVAAELGVTTATLNRYLKIAKITVRKFARISPKDLERIRRHFV